MPEITYPPIDVLKPVAEHVWIVDAGPMKAMGAVPIPVRMTVIQLDNGALILHSPTQFSLALKERLEAVGPISHLVAPSTTHWSFIKEWQSHCPDAICWAVPGLKERPAVQKSGMRIDRVFDEAMPFPWTGEVETVIVRGKGVTEIALFHGKSRTLVLTDLVVNVEPQKLPLPIRMGAALAGSTAPDGKAPAYARAAFKAGGKEAEEAAVKLVAFAPERVIFAHGAWFEKDGTARLEKSLSWLLPS